jgi:hypothetical protein
MKSKILTTLALFLIMSLSAAVSFGVQDDSQPSAFFPETSFEFAPVLDGAKVVHEFVIQNKGNAALKVDKVKTG